jgi:hypothetical protein
MTGSSLVQRNRRISNGGVRGILYRAMERAVTLCDEVNGKHKDQS